MWMKHPLLIKQTGDVPIQVHCLVLSSLVGGGRVPSQKGLHARGKYPVKKDSMEMLLNEYSLI